MHWMKTRLRKRQQGLYGGEVDEIDDIVGTSLHDRKREKEVGTCHQDRRLPFVVRWVRRWVTSEVFFFLLGTSWDKVQRRRV